MAVREAEQQGGMALPLSDLTRGLMIACADVWVYGLDQGAG